MTLGGGYQKVMTLRMKVDKYSNLAMMAVDPCDPERSIQQNHKDGRPPSLFGKNGTSMLRLYERHYND